MRQEDAKREIAGSYPRHWCGFEEMLGAGWAMTMAWPAPFFWAPPVWVIALMWLTCE